MLTASLLKLRAFKCYREPTVLELRDTLYGIYARDASDERRSNYLGKSSLPHAVDYCLTGRLPPDARLKTDWISRGEASGEVEVVLSDQTRVVRSLTRKDSEKLWCFPQGDPKGAFQGEAQAEVDRVLGLTREDSGTWYFAQGQIAGMLRMDPGERLTMFSNWLRLGQIEECQGVAAAARGAIEQQLEAKRKQLAGLDEAERALLSRFGVESGSVGLLDWFDEQEDVAAAEVRALTEEREKVEARDREAAERANLTADAVRYDQVVEEGTRLAAAVKAGPDRAALVAERPRVEAEVQEFGSALAVARMEREQVAVVADGAFDGVCPLLRTTCPSVTHVRSEAARAAEVRSGIDVRVGENGEAYVGAVSRLRLIDGQVRQVDQNLARLETLRASARSLADRRKRWGALGEISLSVATDVERRDLWGKLASAERHVADLRSGREQVGEIDRRRAELRGEVEGLEKLAEVPSAAAMVFERARRQVAEGSLAEVEGLANEVLATLGTDLSVAVTWGRETGGLADNCGKCGAAFPASRKVRHCGKCGEERGQKVSEKLDVTPSRRSGAADDFGGLALALGASRWLREDRGSRWGLAVLDEPTSQMDASLRRSFAAKLPEILVRAGFAQGLVVSHHRETLETLPGRIEVVSRGGWSTARVV